LYPATRTTADCPSGQWERTVNPSAYAYPGSNPGSATEVKRLFPALTTTFSVGASRGIESGRHGGEIIVIPNLKVVRRQVEHHGES
jgi:hypothetical protein